MTKSWAEGSKLAAVLVLGALVLGCGGTSKHGTAVGEEAAPVGGATGNGVGGEGAIGGDAAVEVAFPPGWSLLNDKPFVSPVGTPGVAIIDSQRDRMLTFTGVGASWQLPLSGVHVDQWSRLVVEGDVPPGAVGSAVYDAKRGRVLASINPLQRGGGYADGQLWELSLTGSPRWLKLDTPDVAPGLLAIDADEGRLFVNDTRQSYCGVWSMLLEDDVSWTRLADCIGTASSVFEVGASLLAFDGPRQRLVASASQLGAWELDLEGGIWAPLAGGQTYSSSVVGAYDASGSRLILMYPIVGLLSTFSLVDDTWSNSTFPASFGVFGVGGLAALDTKRNRVLYANGSATSELPLESLNPHPLLPEHSGAAIGAASSLVWDPERQAVVSFGGDGGHTISHSLKRGAAWQPLSNDGTPGYGGIQVYDEQTKGIVAYGSSEYGAYYDNLLRLDSGGSDWENIALPPGPQARTSSLGVLDKAGHRLVICGGAKLDGTDDPPKINDVWALSLDSLIWSKLVRSGQSPGARSGQLGVYDPVGERMIVFGGLRAGDPYPLVNDLYALTLGDDPTWSSIEAEGAGPSAISYRAFYDPAGERMLVLDSASDIYALELSDAPVWHRFCVSGAVPPPLYAGTATLTDAGIFFALNNSPGAYLFNLETPYCD